MDSSQPFPYAHFPESYLVWDTGVFDVPRGGVDTNSVVPDVDDVDVHVNLGCLSAWLVPNTIELSDEAIDWASAQELLLEPELPLAPGTPTKVHSPVVSGSTLTICGDEDFGTTTESVSSSLKSMTDPSNPKNSPPTPIHSCSECGKCFTERKNLLRHCRRHDPKNFKYKCTWAQCARTFCRSDDLDGHFKKHTKKRIECTSNGCNKTFIRRSDMLVHRRKFHSPLGIMGTK